MGSVTSSSLDSVTWFVLVVLNITVTAILEPVERYPIEFRKTKTKVISLVNHKRHNSKQIHVTGAKRGKMSGRKARLVLGFIG